MKPTFEVKLGEAIYASLSSLAAIRVERGLDGILAAASLAFPATAPAETAVGDTVSVDLGYGDERMRTFTGRVCAIRQSLAHQVVQAECPLGLTARTRVSQFYERQTAGAIVQDLAQQCEVQEAETEDGTTLAFYAADDRRSVFEHLLRLAGVCGFHLYSDVNGTLTFGACQGEERLNAAYGVNLLSIEQARAGETATEVRAVGESPSSALGEETSYWLIKDPQDVAATVGEGTPRLVIRSGLVRSQDAAESMAQGHLAVHSSRATTGMTLLLGNAALELGDRLEVKDSPIADGEFWIIGLRHQLDRRVGFVTTVRFADLSDGASA